MPSPRSYTLLAAAIVIAAIVVSAAILVSPAFNATVTQTATKIDTTTVATRPTSLCISPGQPQGAFLEVLNDSTSLPVVGANVTAVEDGYSGNCGNATVSAFTWQTTEVFTTNNTEWYSLNIVNAVDYRFTVAYSGHIYSLILAPLGLSIYTCGTLYLPSGRTNITTSVQTSCALVAK